MCFCNFTSFDPGESEATYSKNDNTTVTFTTVAYSTESGDMTASTLIRMFQDGAASTSTVIPVGSQTATIVSVCTPSCTTEPQPSPTSTPELQPSSMSAPRRGKINLKCSGTYLGIHKNNGEPSKAELS